MLCSDATTRKSVTSQSHTGHEDDRKQSQVNRKKLSSASSISPHPRLCPDPLFPLFSIVFTNFSLIFSLDAERLKSSRSSAHFPQQFRDSALFMRPFMRSVCFAFCLWSVLSGCVSKTNKQTNKLS